MERDLAVSVRKSFSGTVISGTGLWRRISMDEGIHTLITASGLMAIFVAFLAAVQFATPSIAGNDGYYHIKMAYLMRTRGLVPAFDWLPFTVLNASEFVDHHFLYHVLLIPFTFGDLRFGAKLASVLFPAATFLAVWWLLRSRHVPYSGLWSLGLLAVSEAFLYRMSMPRAQSLSLAVLVLGLHWLLAERYNRLLPLAFVYVWLYDGFPLILLLAAAYVLASWLSDRRLEWRVLAYTAAGLALGLVLNPYFPDNLLFIYRHVAPKLLDPTAVQVGSEWYPYKTTQLMENSGTALLLFLAGVLALGLHSGRMKTDVALGLFLSVLFGAMLFKSRRFVEYFPAFALIFAAIAWRPLISNWLAGRAGGVGSPLRRYPAAASSSRPRGETVRRWLLGGLITVMLAPGLYTTLNAARHSLGRSTAYERYAGAAAWLQDHTAAGTRVFQTDWDDFPRLFYYNTHNTYTLGLDPTYMQLCDAQLYENWVAISEGRVDDPSAAIHDQFGATFVLTDLKHRDFLEEADEDPAMVEVYRDGDAAVFQIVVEQHRQEKTG